MEVTIYQSVKVNPVNDPPVILPLPKVTIDQDEEFRLELRDYVQDIDNELTELSFETDYPNNIEVMDSSLKIKFEEKGEYSVNVKVYDGEFADEENLLISVLQVDKVNQTMRRKQ